MASRDKEEEKSWRFVSLTTYREIYAKRIGENVPLETLKMAFAAGTIWKDKHVAVVPDLGKFTLDHLETNQKEEWL